MVHFVNPWAELYRKTLLPEGHLLYLIDSITPGEIHTLDKPESVFAKPPGDMLTRVLPMAELQMELLNPQYREKLYFIYDECGSDLMMYRLTEENKIDQLVFVNEAGEIKQVMDEYEFENGAAQNYESISTSERRYFRLFQDRPMPDGNSFEGHHEYGDWINEGWSDALNKSRELGCTDMPKNFGPWFRPTQNTIYPVMMDHSPPDFYYAGRFDADWLDLCDFNYFLFYHPQTRTVVQVKQCT